MPHLSPFLSRTTTTIPLRDTFSAITPTPGSLLVGNNASVIWENTYLANATARFKKLAGGYNWTVADTYNVSIMAYPH